MSRPGRSMVAAALAALALVAILLGRQIPSRPVRGDPGPQALPLAAAAIIVAGAAAAFAGDVRRAPAEAAQPAGFGLSVAAGTVAYLLLLPLAGFVPATAFFLAAASRALDRHGGAPTAVHALVGAAASLALWAAFGRLLGVTLPAGPLGF